MSIHYCYGIILGSCICKNNSLEYDHLEYELFSPYSQVATKKIQKPTVNFSQKMPSCFEKLLASMKSFNTDDLSSYWPFAIKSLKIRQHNYNLQATKRHRLFLQFPSTVPTTWRIFDLQKSVKNSTCSSLKNWRAQKKKMKKPISSTSSSTSIVIHLFTQKFFQGLFSFGIESSIQLLTSLNIRCVCPTSIQRSKAKT